MEAQSTPMAYMGSRYAQYIVALEPFPTVSQVADAIFGVPVPRARADALNRQTASMEEVCDTLVTAAREYNVPTSFFISLIWQESRFDPRAVSPVGAQGVAQFMPQVAYAMGLDDPFDPLEALPASAKLLRELLAQFDNNLGYAAAAYNAGPRRIFNWIEKGIRLPKETRDYVRKITGHAAQSWRKTKLGKLELDVPKRAPCRRFAVAEAEDVVTLIPASVATEKARVTKSDVSAQRKRGDAKTRALSLKARKALVVRTAAAKAVKKKGAKVASN